MIFQSEFVWIAIIIIITSITIFYAIYYSSTFSIKTQEIFRFSVFDDLALKTLTYLYTLKFELLEKSPLQMMIDSLLYLRRYGEEEREKFKENLGLGDKVFYGIELGSFNVSDIIYPIFDNLIGKERWQLIIYYNKNLYHIYGYEISKNVANIKSYILSIPIPDGEIGYVVLRVV